ncbi:MAG TPA: hypothetical protein DGO43_03100, partial [Chloroflexi bacterium]|nr:hypothetical protein [Chloroflexota bacterium]
MRSFCVTVNPDRTRIKYEPSTPTQVISEGLTYDDVLLVPGRSDVIPTQVNTSTKITEAVTLTVPLL